MKVKKSSLGKIVFLPKLKTQHKITENSALILASCGLDNHLEAPKKKAEKKEDKPES